MSQRYKNIKSSCWIGVGGVQRKAMGEDKAELKQLKSQLFC